MLNSNQIQKLRQSLRINVIGCKTSGQDSGSGRIPPMREQLLLALLVPAAVLLQEAPHVRIPFVYPPQHCHQDPLFGRTPNICQVYPSRWPEATAGGSGRIVGAIYIINK